MDKWPFRWKAEWEILLNISTVVEIFNSISSIAFIRYAKAPGTGEEGDHGSTKRGLELLPCRSIVKMNPE